MAIATLTFEEFAPDQAPLGSAYSPSVKNVLPIGKGYRSWSSLATQTDALTQRVQGFIATAGDDGLPYNIAAVADKIFRRSGASWTNISGQTYSTASDSVVAFQKWGNEVIASNFVDTMQVATISSGSFAALGGQHAPRAKYLATMGRQGQFLIAAYLSDGGTTYPRRVQWPGIGSATTWTASAATQADSQDIENCSEIRGLAGFDYLVIGTDRGLWRADYVGPPVIMDFSEMEKGRGIMYPGLMASWGRLVFYLWEDGFYLFDGTAVSAIGAEKVNRFFFNDVDVGYLDRVRIAPDPVNSCFVVAYPGRGASAGALTKLLAWSWTVNRWVPAEPTTPLEHLALGLTVGYTLSELDGISATLAGLPYPLGSRNYAGGRPGLTGFDNTHKLGLFAGAAMIGQMDTAEKQLSAGQRSLIQQLRPLIDGSAPSDVSAQIIGRALQSSTRTTGAEITQAADGLISPLDDNRYHAIRLKTYGNFDYALGAEVEFMATGSF